MQCEHRLIDQGSRNHGRPRNSSHAITNVMNLLIDGFAFIYLSMYNVIDLLPVAELIIQNIGSAGARGLVSMLCQYGGLPEAFGVSRWAYGWP